MTEPVRSRNLVPGAGQDGPLVELTVGPVAHGGHCVAHLDGRVVFVRLALPGERVLARITDTSHRSFWRAEVVQVHSAAPGRVQPDCVAFGPDGCGGCDFLHAAPSLQRSLKAAVVTEQLTRLAGISWPDQLDQVWDGQVEALPGPAGRIRVRWAAADGTLGPRRWRSHQVVRVTADFFCRMADPAVNAAAAQYRGSAAQVTILRGADGICAVTPVRVGRDAAAQPGTRLVEAAAKEPRSGAVSDVVTGTVRQVVCGKDFYLSPGGFWQAHPAAPEVFVQAVLDGCADVLPPGGTAWDLYGGVGLFAAFLADLVGPHGRVVSVESDRRASAMARRNLAGSAARARCGRVDQVLTRLPGPVDVVVVDPPRAGAGRRVCQQLLAAGPKRIVYVACDPAALARDIGILCAGGYRLARLRAFDAFPGTHHVECIAVLQR